MILHKMNNNAARNTFKGAKRSQNVFCDNEFLYTLFEKKQRGSTCTLHTIHNILSYHKNYAFMQCMLKLSC